MFYKNNKISLTAGYDIYTGGLFANFNFQEGDFFVNVSAGIEIAGWNVNAGIQYSPGDYQFGIGGGIGSNYKAWGSNAALMAILGYHRTYYGNKIPATC